MAKSCPNCSNELPYDEAKFCPECGTRQNVAKDEAVKKDQKKDDRKQADQEPKKDPSATLTEREMLAGKPKEELVNIVIQGKPADPTGTDELSFDPKKIPFGPASFEADITLSMKMFKKVPEDAPEDAKVMYRVVLISANNQNQPLGLDLVADAVIGRETQGVVPDVDLTPHGGGVLGVSRRHAILRPMEEGLVLVDLASKNGTFLNGSKIDAGVAKPINDMDVLSFAGVHFLAKFASASSKK